MKKMRYNNFRYMKRGTDMRAIMNDLSEKVNLDEYHQTRTPDKPELARLLKEAKGEQRNMSDFARQCGSSPATFSRIANCKITQPIDKELLLRIAQNADRDKIPVDRVSDDELSNWYLLCFLNANGMVDNEFIERKKTNPAYGFRFEEDEELFGRENEVINTISIELLNRGYVMQYIGSFDEEEGIDEMLHPRKRGRLTVRIQRAEPKYHSFRAICMDLIDQQELKEDIAEGEEPEEYYYMWRANGVLSNQALELLNETWNPIGFEKVKTSYVFDDKKLYEAFCMLMKDKKVYSWRSAVLVDLERQCIVEEKYIKRYDGKEGVSLFEKDKI